MNKNNSETSQETSAGIFRSGFAAFIGRPNVGKSSLINSLLREKTAAVSRKPQTTRNAVRCILTTDSCQIVIVDTPGAHNPRHALGEFMMSELGDALSSVDVICLITEAGREMDNTERSVIELVNASPLPKILVVNKIDLCGQDKEERFWRCLAPIQEMLKPSAVVPVSAKSGVNLDILRDSIAGFLPEGELIYPEDVLMDTTERFLAEEIIREKIFEATEQEVPHSVAVAVEEFKTPDEYPELRRAEIRADIIVERLGQKGILIGEGGAKLKEIGSAARAEMEARFGYPMVLRLWVKVKPGWRKSSKEIARVGYKKAK
ncbi:GTPase Era [Synergistales bacterium]|nr:GTPase Era [Synergistales bacterium]